MTVYVVRCGDNTTTWDSTTQAPPSDEVADNDYIVTSKLAERTMVILHLESSGTRLDWRKEAHGLEAIREVMSLYYGPLPVTVAAIGP